MLNVNKLAAAPGASEEFLGELLWYTLPDLRIKREDLSLLLDAEGISHKHLPGMLNNRDAFRRAVKAAEITNQPMAGSEKKLNLLSREVANDCKFLAYQIVREIVDSQNRRLSYEPIVELRLVGKSRHFVTEILLPPSFREENALREVEAAYERNLVYHDAGAVRRLVRSILDETSCISVRPSGGVYYIPQEHAKTVAALRNLIRALGNHAARDGSKPEAWSVPVVDAAEQRKMIAASLDSHIEAEAAGLLGDLKATMKNGSPQQKTIDGYMARAMRLKTQVFSYKKKLALEAEVASRSVSEVESQILALLGVTA